ncbi:CBS domain-containing protein [Endozoicomonas sp. Mp262]|uniref:CBS domain-containing protein n=1 Tax=Endozoicomonas sp. Mp262 TaxID=2919499 RepID=UPI0021DB583F
MRSLKVQDCMTRKVVTLSPEMEVVEAIRILLDYDITAAPVVNDDGVLVGILSEMDCLKSTVMGGYFSQESGIVEEHMAKNVVIARPQEDIISVYTRFMKGKAFRIPVLKDGVLVGMLSPKDVMSAVLEFYEKPALNQQHLAL